MNQSKFSLADVITVLTALAFGFVCFLSLNFYTLGDTTRSIIIAVIIAVLLSGTALGAIWLKRTKSKFKTCLIFEIILLILFTVFTVFTACFTYSPFSHYFVVSEKEHEIQKKLSASITQFEKMFKEYENYVENRKDLYLGELDSAVMNRNIDRTKHDSLGLHEPPISYQSQIRDKMTMMTFDLLPSNLKKMKTVDSIWLAKSMHIVNDWKRKPIGIVNVINKLEDYSNNSKEKLIKISTIRELAEEAQDFKYDLQNKNVKTHFTALGKPTPLSIGLAIIAWLLMLLSYLISKRDTKSNIFRNSKKDRFDVEY